MDGIVKWFIEPKGWGFIKPDGGGNDVFAHYSQIKGDGFKTLKPGERVSFELIHSPKGDFAQDIVAIGIEP